MSDDIQVTTEYQPDIVPAEDGTGAKGFGDYHLISLSILPSDGSGEVDIKNFFYEINYYEDIFAPAICGDMILSDSQGMIEKLNLCGNEYLIFTLSKDSNSPDEDSSYVIKKTFRVYKIGKRNKNNNDAVENYIIYFCSDEMLINSQYRISKSYSYMNIKDIVVDILENYLQVSSDRYNPDILENTDGVYNFIVPNLKPFEAINWLMQYAKSADNTSIGNDMIFFENKDGYVMASIQSLTQQNSTGTYKYQPKNLTQGLYIDSADGNLGALLFNIDHYEIETSFDSMKAIMSGSMANHLLAINPLKQSYNVHTFSYADYQAKSKSLNGNAIINNLQNRLGDDVTKTSFANFKLAFTNTDNEQNAYVQTKPQGSVTNSVFIEDVMTLRKAQLNLINYHKVKIQMGGNPFITVGQVINFDLLSTTPSGSPDEIKSSDKLYSGNYLVSAVRHTITPARYMTIAEIIKDSLTSDADNIGLPSAVNSDSDIQSIVSDLSDEIGGFF